MSFSCGWYGAQRADLARAPVATMESSWQSSHWRLSGSGGRLQHGLDPRRGSLAPLPVAGGRPARGQRVLLFGLGFLGDGGCPVAGWLLLGGAGRSPLSSRPARSWRRLSTPVGRRSGQARLPFPPCWFWSFLPSPSCTTAWTTREQTGTLGTGSASGLLSVACPWRLSLQCSSAGATAGHLFSAFSSAVPHAPPDRVRVRTIGD